VGQSILLTGATGAVGPHLLQELLQDDAFERVFVLIRPAAQRDPVATLHDTLRRVIEGTGQRWPHHAERRVIPVAGDVCGERLVADPVVANRLKRDVDVIVHAAAKTRFTAPESELHDVNVRGAWHVLRLASHCQRLRQLLLVSTTCVAGTRTGLIAERVEVQTPQFVNAYEHSKWQAERISMAADLPVRIARLSTCMGDGRTGYVHRFGAFHHSLHWFVRGLIPMIPAADGARVDAIPTDLAARWLARAATRPPERHEVCQVAAGHAAIPVQEFLDVVVTCLRARTQGWARRQIEPPVVVDAHTFTLFQRTAIQSGDALFRRVLESVGTFLPALLYSKVYQTEHAAACWGGALSVGDWRTTIERVIDFALKRGWRSRAGAAVHYA
jgi:thioester reductase-like protein